MSEADRRRDPRAKIWLVVKYRALAQGQMIWQEGTITDISAGGLRLSCDRALEQESRVEIQMRLPDRAEPLTIQGEVRWAAQQASGTESGVMFIDVSPERQFDLDALVQFLVKKRTSE